MSRSSPFFLALVLSFGTTYDRAAAQLSSALDSELGNRFARTSLITMSGFDDVHAGTAATLFGGGSTFSLGLPVAHIDAGLLMIPSGANAASLRGAVAFPLRGTQIRLGLAIARQGGDSARNLISPRVEMRREGWSVGFQTSLMRGLPATFKDTTLVLEGDSSAVGHIETRPRQPARMAGNLFGGYQTSWSRFEVGGVVNARLAAMSRGYLSGTITASARIAHGLAIGASFGREAGYDWLARRTRNTTLVFLRMDGPFSSGAGTSQPFATVTTTGQTLITVTAAGASHVEVIGDFSDWKPVRMQRARNAQWTYAPVLTPGLYHIRIRVDDGPWVAPRGLPALSDDMGGTTGLFEVPPRGADS